MINKTRTEKAGGCSKTVY